MGAKNANPNASDAVCAICAFSGDADAPLHKCTGCGLTGHPECFSPALQLASGESTSFCCPNCASGAPAEPRTCALCSGTEGAMVATLEGQWVHGVCALYVPGVSLVAESTSDTWLASGVPALLARAGPSFGGAPCAAPGCSLAVHPSSALEQRLRMGSVAHFGAERYFLLCPTHSSAAAQHEPSPVVRAEQAAIDAEPPGRPAQTQEEEYAEEVARRRESKASKLIRLSGSAAQVGKGGQGLQRKASDPWWMAYHEYVPPVAWASLLPVGTERASFDRRLKVARGPPEDRAPAASLDRPKAWGSRTHRRAPLAQRRGLPWPQRVA